MTPEQRCRSIAARQHGIVHRRQALDSGLTPSGLTRRVLAKEWRRVFPATYQVGPQDRGRRGLLMAASLWAAPEGVVSHRSAGWLYGFKIPWTPLVDVTLPKKKKAPPGIALHFDRVLFPTATFAGIRVPRAEIVLMQLCGVLNLNSARAVIDRAIHDGVVGVDSLSRALERYGSTKRHGLATFREILMDRFGIGETDSWAEDAFARLARKHGLNLVHHHVVRDRDFVAELDFADLVTKVNIEIDGSLVHNNPIQTEKDKRRDVELSLRGWLVLRFTYRELTQRPEWVLASIRTAISDRTLKLFS